MKLRFHHCALTVRDMKESIQWYTRMLGFSVSSKYENKGMQIAILTCGECLLELFHFVDKTKSLPTYRTKVMSDLAIMGTKHICFETDNIKDTISELKRRGVEFASDIDTTFYGGQFVFIRDCNGILIELFERGKKI